MNLFHRYGESSLQTENKEVDKALKKKRSATKYDFPVFVEMSLTWVVQRSMDL